jgi:hypothetical protein
MSGHWPRKLRLTRPPVITPRRSRPRVSTVVAATVFIAATIVYLTTDQNRDRGSLGPTSPVPTVVAGVRR